MAYIGKQPRKAALTSSDIEDGIITAAKIEDGAVVAAEIASNAVTTAKINADAVTSAKIADNAVVTAGINADAVTGAKIADDAISEEHLDVTAITGHTAETTVADGDLVVIHDASATALRKMTVANLTANAGVSGISSSADATAMTISSNENIGIGVTDPDNYDATAHELVVGKTNAESGITIRSSSSAGNLYFADGTSGAEKYQGFVQYDHNNSKMNLGTAGATQWSLDSSGNFLPAATDHGIYLGVTSATAANLLDDYEEGTWTPTFTNGGSSLSNVSISKANYTKIGRMIWIEVNAQYTGSTLSGTYIIGDGLPFTSAQGNIIINGTFAVHPGSGDSNQDVGAAGSHDSNTNFYMVPADGNNRYLKEWTQNYYMEVGFWYFV